MPKCIHCGRRYKVMKDKCLTVSFSTIDGKGERHRETYYYPMGFCPKCHHRLMEFGPKAMLNDFNENQAKNRATVAG